MHQKVWFVQKKAWNPSGAPFQNIWISLIFFYFQDLQGDPITRNDEMDLHRYYK